MSLYRVAIIGSGNWGSAIAKLVGYNVARHPTYFHSEVRMWVFEEVVNGRKLSDIINETNENVKYLPGVKIPSNVVAVPDLVSSVTDSDILIWVIPHQFVKRTCTRMKDSVKKGAVSVSCIKGLQDKAELALITCLIKTEINTDCAVLMGANIANEVAKEEFSESTIGCDNEAMGEIFRKLFHTSYFRVNTVPDATTVELCGALKNIVAVAAGFIDGLGMGGNTKAAVIRLGMQEMIKFCNLFSSTCKESTFFESCGLADLITTCYGGRNRKVSEAFVRTGKSFDDLEVEMLGGQKLQGPMTSKEVYNVLLGRDLTDEYPLFVTVYKICYCNEHVNKLITNVSVD